jgi:iron complex transport system substrate-binding protein
MSQVRRTLFAILTILTSPLAAAAAEPQRVVSINVCTDQYLLALADREQIAALSPYASDRGLAFFAERADGIPTTSGAAEAVLTHDPDLVLTGTFTKRATRAMLERLGYRVLDIPPAQSWQDVRDTTRTVAEALGHPERAERWIAALDAALASVRAAGPPEGRLRALNYQRRGYATGTDTLMNRLFTVAGLENAAAEAGIRAVRQLSLETVVRLRPDILVFDRPDIDLTDVGSDLLRHPALARAVPDSRQIVLPQRLTVCGGPSLADAIATLQDAVAAVMRERHGR